MEPQTFFLSSCISLHSAEVRVLTVPQTLFMASPICLRPFSWHHLSASDLFRVILYLLRSSEANLFLGVIHLVHSSEEEWS